MPSKPMPSEIRILTTLLLQPMTNDKIAACLSLETDHIRKRLVFLVGQGEVMRRGTEQQAFSKAKPRNVYSLTPKGRSWAMEFAE